ncbi:uncharacterized protein LOC143288099 [Babylonia areolata]|uniref:uncharacterized protein LOC143288099 n=1 Tax=Babylonia areolata TaxID=304850 RepID=UPI003FD65223
MMSNNTLATVTSSDDSFVRVKNNGPAYQHQDSSQIGGDMGTDTHRQEAYYLFFMGAVGIALNVIVIITILVRRTLRKMTSAFLIHACFLNLLKSAYLIPFGVNLLGDDPPADCSFEGSSYVVIVTTSAFNMVAMICAEAYTFGENNVGGKSRGSFCCVLFGVLMVYVCSVVLHLGPTLIGGYFQYNPQIGNCTFKMGEVTGYIANVMWICIVTLSLVAVAHFLCKMYKEIQQNQPNRVSMLVRSSITIMDDAEAKRNSCSIRVMVKEASHRAKIFVITVLAYVISWYPLFLLMLIDVDFKVSPKVYQAFSFIAWTQGTVEPIVYICFDRQLNLLARWIYCDRYKQYDSSTLAYLMAQNRGPVSADDSVGNAIDGPPRAGAAASAMHNSVGYRGGAAAYPYQDDGEEERVSEGSTSHPTPSPPPAPLDSGGGHPGSTVVHGVVEPVYGNQRAVSPGSLEGTQHQVEVNMPHEIEC